jgi:hypothetical protein
VRRWEYRQAGAQRPGDRNSHGVPPLDSSVSDSPEPVVAR